MNRASHPHRPLWRLTSLLAAAALVLALPAVPASAASVSVSGSIDPATSPSTPNTPQISTPNCTGLTVFTIHYEIIPMVATATGAYTITEPGTNSAIVVTEGPADPAALNTNCIAASNSNPISLGVNLTAGTRYDIVVLDDTFTQAGLDYTVGVEGESTVALGTADLGISLAAAPGPHPPGGAVEFTATITNGGPQAATDAEVTLTLPDGFDPGSISGVAADAGYSCGVDLVAGTVTCTADGHPAGAEATISFTANVAADATPGTYTVSGEVSSATVDTDEENNTVGVDVRVELPATTTTTAAPTTTTTQQVAAVVATPSFTG